MLNLFFNILSSDINLSLIVDIVSTIASIVLSIIAIVISILTLVQNNKMIFESSKPNITIFSKVIDFTSPHTFLILKNFGNSGAIILDIKYDEALKTFLKKEPFQHMKNIFIAPNQSFIFPLEKPDNIDKPINFKVTYKYLNKVYTENHIVSFSHYKDFCYLKVHNSKDLKELSEVLQEMTIQNI